MNLAATPTWLQLTGTLPTASSGRPRSGSECLAQRSAPAGPGPASRKRKSPRPKGPQTSLSQARAMLKGKFTPLIQFSCPGAKLPQMDKDDALEGTLYSRREVAKIVAYSGLSLAFGGALSETTPAAQTKPFAAHLVASPSATEGPFFVDEHLQRSDLSGGTSRPSINDAVPLMLAFRVFASARGKDFQPLPGAQVDVWHVDALGVYSDEPEGLNPQDTTGQTWLRGFQRTTLDGRAAFKTIFPGWYRGRTTHIHFKVRYSLDPKGHASFTSQLFMPDALADKIYQNQPYSPRPTDETHNQDDNVFRDGMPGGGQVGSVLTLNPRPVGNGYRAEYNVALITHPHPSLGSHDWS